jgi:hypothetical protein
LEEELINYRAYTEKYALRIGFVIGIVLALAGFRILHVIFDMGDLDPNQEALFNGIDILLTATLVSGGSKGVNKVTARIQEALENPAQRNSSGENKSD